MGNFCDCCGVRAKGPEGLPEYGSGGSAKCGFALARNDRARMEDAGGRRAAGEDGLVSGGPLGRRGLVEAG